MKISVITPSFNQAQFLPFNLASVEGQTHNSVEHIIIDPGSNDGSRDIAAAARHALLIAEPDRGQSDGITKGFSRSTGDVLTWLNSDDLYPSEQVLQIVAKEFEKSPKVDVIYGNVNFVDEKGAFLRKGYINKNPDTLLESFQYQVGIVQPGLFLRRSVFDAVGGPSEQYEYCMDYEYWVRIVKSGFKWKFIDEVLAHHRWWDGMKTSKDRDVSLVEHMRVCSEYFGYIHYKWLDRYAEYITSNMDGVVNHSSNTDQAEKYQNLKAVIERFVSQDMLRQLEKSDDIQQRKTLDFIRANAPALQRYYFPATDISMLSESHPDPKAPKRSAWHIFDGVDAQNRTYKTYNVPNNFHRVFDAQWYEDSLKASAQKLRCLSNKKTSKTCIVVANGPSLNNTEFSLLSDVDVIISNFAILNESLVEAAAMITVTNTLVAEQGSIAFNNIRAPKIFPIWLSNQLNQTEETCFVSATVRPEFCTSLSDEFSWRSTVSFFNMQLAYVLGYEKVLLVGFDHSYVQPDNVREGDRINQKEDDSNHFDPRYFKDRVWQAADTNNMEEMYRLAKAAFESDGREIVNCTVGGQLEVFRRGHLELELLNKPSSDVKLMPLVSRQKDASTSENKTDALSAAIKQLPRDLQFPIFLPTDRIAPEAQLEGVNRVRKLYDGRMEAHREKLRELKKARTSDRCVIIGNGPSLNKTDLSLLEDVDTFAVNGFFLKSEELGWKPTYYVVEDHLVAEDRARWINGLKGSKKLFPAYLAYCLQEDDETIFFDHRPRKSYPHGFDFSEDASINTYAGCTVTYTCMQLAHYLGYKEIYLVGVDASYQLPGDVKQDSAYGTSVLDMESDDPNHFHPDYFGKGFRWHDPQVDKMLEAYAEARRVTDKSGRRIYNATIGGKLEVFERRAFQDVFSKVRSAESVEVGSPEPIRARSPEHTEADGVSRDCPRILVFDLTLMGDGTATGEVKRNLFGSWPADRYLQVYNAGGNRLGVKSAHEKPVLIEPSDLSALHRAIKSFKPELILYRPVPDAPMLHQTAMQMIREYADIPLATWIMDDWLARLETEDPEQFLQMEDDWRALLANSNLRMSISQKMSETMQARYGFEFEPYANGVDPSEWQIPHSRSDGSFTVRYAGALADNMTAQSVLRVAQAVELLANAGQNIKMEIQTKPLWRDRQAAHYVALKHTRFRTDLLSPEDYRAWLSGADAVVIGYNFDPDSLRYIGSSMANKMPECLASGAPLLAHGPMETATISFLSQLKCAKLVTKPDVQAVAAAILSLINHPDEARAFAEKARSIAFNQHNIFKIRARFIMALTDAVKNGNSKARLLVPPERPRSHHAQVDETAVVARMLSDRMGTQHIMLDVGAHFGTSAAYFHDLGWTIHCFEPDPNNRAKLLGRFGKAPNVRIDPRAVSDKPATGLQFFTSPESTGISGLLAFRDTHAVTATVDATTVADIIKDRGLERIDFLKIDVEGFDLNVLKGVPWDELPPDVVECEFEDAKTLKLGHDWKHVADYLESKGYTVYVSEWHPIIRYGIPHDWRRVVPYRGCVLGADAWGNFVAFRKDPGYAAVAAAFEKLLTKRAPVSTAAAAPASQVKAPEPEKAAPTTSPTSTAEPVSMPQQTTTPPDTSELAPPPAGQQKQAWYAPFGNAVRKYAPALFPFLQRVRQIVWKLTGSPAVWLAAAGGLVAVGLTLEGPWPLEQRFILAGGVLGAAGLAALALMAWRLRRYIANLSAQNRALFSEIERIHDLTKAREARAERLTGHQEGLRGEIASLRSESSKTQERLFEEQERLFEEIARLHSESNKTVASVHQNVSTVIGKLDARLIRQSAEIEALAARQNEQAVKNEQAVESQLEVLHQRLNAVLEEQSRLKDQADSGANALTAVKGELEESMKALRQGLEQRMFAEIDEYAKGTTSELIARLDVLKKALDDELKPQVGEAREIAASARNEAAEVKKAVQIGEILNSRLRERAEASERQIGALRYPDAPDVFVYFGHHKCASRFFRYEVFGRIAESTGARTRKYEITNAPFHYSRMDELDLVNIDFKELGKNGRDVVWFANASQRCLNKIKRNADNWKGLRIIRDPRQVLISNYIHHKGDHPDESPLGWVWDQLVKDKPILRELPEEDGILHELDNISKQVIEDQILAPFDDERVMTVRLEDYSKDPRGHLLQISEFLKVPDVAGIDFGNTKANPDSGPWQKYFTTRIREAFKERYGQALIDLGYAEDMDW